MSRLATVMEVQAPRAATGQPQTPGGSDGGDAAGLGASGRGSIPRRYARPLHHIAMRLSLSGGILALRPEPAFAKRDAFVPA